MSKLNVKNLALAGIIGPLIFTVVIIVNASLRSDYNHMSQFISALGATNTPHAAFINYAGFITFGLLMVAFAISLFILLPKNTGTRIGSVGILFFGTGIFLAGVFSCDAGCPLEGSITNNLHHRISALAFISGIISTGVLGFSFKKLSEWRSIWLYSIITFAISLVLLVVMINSFETRIYTGLWQRLLLFTLFAWLVRLALKIINSSNE